EAHEAVHAGDSDRREQRADGGGDQCDEERDEHDDGDRTARIRDVARDCCRGEDEDKPTSMMVRAISLGVFWRSAPSTSLIMRSRKVEPAAAVMRTRIQSDSTCGPPVTAERAP